MRRRIGRAAVLATVVLSLAGCSQKAREPFRDAPTSPERNNGPARVIEFPDGFSNMAAKCDGPNMVYSPYKGENNRTAIAVAPNDPRCRS
jgi:hypothetical protein